MRLAFSTANYVGRASGYALQPFTWREAERLTVARTDLTAFMALCKEVATAKFRYVDVWKAHAWPTTLTPEYADELLAALRQYNLEPISYAGELDADFSATLRSARLLGMTQVCGPVIADTTAALAVEARRRSIRICIENEVEQHPRELLDKIGLDEDILGVCVDTGAWLAQGYDPAQAIRELDSHVWHVHLKDMRAWGSQEQVRLGSGALDVAAVLDALQAINYNSTLTFEQETAHSDPMADVIAARELVEQLLPQRGGLMYE